MCGYLIVIKIITKTILSCKCYMDGQRMNMYTLIVYIIHGSFGDVILSHDLWLDVGCDFTYVTKTILIIKVDYNYSIVAK
jgi:hypothetical protein